MMTKSSRTNRKFYEQPEETQKMKIEWMNKKKNKKKRVVCLAAVAPQH